MSRMNKIKIHAASDAHVIRRRLLIILTLCLALNAVVFQSVSAKGEERLVRVGWFQVDHAQERDENGNPCGFVYDCLTELARYTGFTYEFVDCTFNESNELLKSGDIDLMFFLRYLPEREQYAFFADGHICTVTTDLYCRAELAGKYTDIHSVDGARVAANTGSVLQERLAMLAEENNISVSFVGAEDSYESIAAVQSGRADYALIDSLTDVPDDFVLVDSFDMRHSHIAVSRKSDSIIMPLNRALTIIAEDNPDFFSSTFESYFGDIKSSKFFLTQAEREAVAKLGALRVYVSDANGYLSRLENGEYKGIRVDIAKRIAENLGIPCEFIQVKNVADMINWQENTRVDFTSGFYFDYQWANKCGVQLTQPYLTQNYYCLRNKSSTADDDNAIVALLASGNYFSDNFIVPNYRQEQLLRPGNQIACIKKVNDGDADMTFVSSYMAEYYLQSYDYPNITATLTNYVTKSCFATRADMDHNVITAFNKALQAISESELNGIIMQNVSASIAQPSWKTLTYRNPTSFVLICCLAILVACTMVFAFWYFRRMKLKNIQLQEASEAKSEFLSRMSHDMRTPLNAVLGFADLAGEEPEISPQVKDYLSKINSSGQYLLGLINDVLDMAKIESGKITLNEQSVNGPQFLSAIEDDFRRQAEEKGIRLITDFSKSQTPWVMMDPLRSRQIYSNLLSNAIKYSDSGTEIYWGITDTPVDEHNMHMVAVIRDQGRGMTPEFMKHMFDAFEQENAPTIGSGVGLGLSIVKALVTLMGGTISTESEPGKGTTFTLEMDRRLGEAEPQIALSDLNFTQKLQGKRVLLAEDYPLNMQIASMMLEKQGMSVETAENGQLTVEKFNDSAIGYYDVILMDIRMPVMGGLEATRVIRALDRSDAKKIPIIAMTANAFDEDVDKSIAAGMNAHLTKPIDPKKMYETLTKHI